LIGRTALRIGESVQVGRRPPKSLSVGRPWGIESVLISRVIS